MYCYFFLLRDTSKWLQISKTCSLGGKEVSFDFPKNLEKQIKLNGISKEAKMYYLLKLRGTIYSSAGYQRASKTVNSVAQYVTNDGSTIIVRIQFFLLDQQKSVLFCGKIIPLEKEWQFIKGWKRSSLIRVKEDPR